MQQTNQQDITSTRYETLFSYHVVIGWKNVRLPGFYVSTRSGHGFRVTQTFLHPQSGPRLTLLEAEGDRFVRISADPYISAMAAKLLCVDKDIIPHF